MTHENEPEGSEIVVRQDASTLWAVVRIKRLAPGAKATTVLAFVRPTIEEKQRWNDTVRYWGKTPLNTGGYFVNGVYRHEADEAAVLARWMAGQEASNAQG